MPRAKKADTKSDEKQAAYRKRAETAPIVTTEGEWKHTFSVAVYWPGSDNHRPEPFEEERN